MARPIAAASESKTRRPTTSKVIWSQIRPPISRNTNSMRGSQGLGISSPSPSMSRCRSRWAPHEHPGKDNREGSKRMHLEMITKSRPLIVVISHDDWVLATASRG
jgi:hypothetical protein